MKVPLRMNKNKRGVLAYLKTPINSQSFSSSTPKGPVQNQSSAETASVDSACRGRISKSNVFDARELGITVNLISKASRFVLQRLQCRGFKSYLVGGCVRDLLLNRTPKDFDVITTAKLKEVRKHFGYSDAIIVGRRFPVCLVHTHGSVIEVTSFETESKTPKGPKKCLYSLFAKCSNKKDQFLSKNSMRRDFTINSLFYDPFANQIYDFANGMTDLRSSKLETVIPAQLSFEEDPGRILRGFRIAARLGLSLSRETEAAIRTCSSLVKEMNKDRIMVEMNYMLSYGAAEPSLHLLWKFKLLRFLLPVQAAYLDEQATIGNAQPSNMLMKLFFHLDKLVGCGRPSDCTLWIGLLAFHQALVNNPQDALVVWAFASVLYHGEWEGGVKFAKERSKMRVNFAPEIKRSSTYESDEEIAKAVTKFASLVIKNTSLSQPLSSPSSPSSSMVFVSGKTRATVSAIFKVLVKDIELYKNKRKNAEINYDMLGKGHISETRFVLGKIILETMSSGIVRDGDDFEVVGDGDDFEVVGDGDDFEVLEDGDDFEEIGQLVSRKDKEHKLVENGCIAEQKMGLGNSELFKLKETNDEHQKPVKLHQKVDLSKTKDSVPKKKNCDRKQLINDRRKITSAIKSSLDHPRHLKMDEHKTCTSSQSTVSKNHQASKCHTKTEGTKEIGQLAPRKDKRRLLSTPNPEHRQEKIKKQKLVENGCIAEQKIGLGNHELLKQKETNEEHKKPVKLRKKVDLSKIKDSLPENENCDRKQLINNIRKIASPNKKFSDHPRPLKMDEHNTCTSSQSTVCKNHQVIANNCSINMDVTTDESVDKVVNKRGRQQPQKNNQSLPRLSSLFK